MADEAAARWFALLNEIGIIAQLSRARIETHFPEGVLLPHFSVLNHLIRVGDGPTPLELARAFQTPKTTMTHTLAALERRGWIRTEANAEDRRSKRVFITEAGRAFRGAAISALSDDLALLNAAFGVEEAEDLAPRLAEIRRFLDAARDGAS